ncbi:MAG: hypothetical protein QOG49_905 [Frankiaceae bacterium]|jgi:glutathione S-transferase|nr:hypothetical protein [Frankiaceae bacterium]
MDELFHIAAPGDWAAAQRTGFYAQSTRDRTLAQQGFIHASTAAQWPRVRTALYADVDDDLLLLVIDPARLTAAVRMEVGEPASGELFPHIYGPIPVGAVVEARPLRPPH